MQFLSLLVGKIILKILRALGRAGSAAPGLAVEKLNPKFLAGMLSQLPQGVIVMTGTNGKTTTTKITVALLEAQGLRVLTNKTGSNFVRGTVTAVVDKATWGGKLLYDIAVLEQDEAHAVHFVRQVKPRGVVVLNIMRDQMDRFGEIDTTAKMLQSVVASATDWLVLNANDNRVSQLKPSGAVKTVWYGHSKDLQRTFLTDDELHHGDDTAYYMAAAMDTELTAYDKASITIDMAGRHYVLQSPLAGSHNAINLTAALTVLRVVKPDFDVAKMTTAVTTLIPAFGRGEVIRLEDGTQVTLQLVKNPGGFTQALGMLDLQQYTTVALAINDDYADGRDVSWLWDVDFNRLEGTAASVLCGGSRGYDMAVRLKYDGVTASEVNLDITEFVNMVNQLAAGQTAIIFCTYTAMLKIRLLYKKYSTDIHGAMS